MGDSALYRRRDHEVYPWYLLNSRHISPLSSHYQGYRKRQTEGTEPKYLQWYSIVIRHGILRVSVSRSSLRIHGSRHSEMVLLHVPLGLVQYPGQLYVHDLPM